MSISREDSTKQRATRPGACTCGLGKGALRGHPSWCPASFPTGWDAPAPSYPDSKDKEEGGNVCPI